MERRQTKINYQKLPPPENLKAFVQYIWVLESEGTDLSLKYFGPLADGCPGLIYQPWKIGRFYDQNDKLVPEVFLYGQSIKLTQLYLAGNFKSIGICFYPNALKAVFGFNANELTDHCLDLNLLSGNQSFTLYEQLLNAPAISVQVKILTAYLYALIRKNNIQPDGITQAALFQIIKSKGDISLKELQHYLRLSERTFQRKFEQHVGISPKLYARVCRFQASLNQLKNNAYAKLSDIAFDNGYADQSHFIRAFKEFAGYAPHEYQKYPSEIIPGFPVLIKEPAVGFVQFSESY